MTASAVVQLDCAVQEYAWGRVGNESAIAGLLPNANATRGATAEGTPLAELWMGDHVNGPARLTGSGTLLSEHMGARGLGRLPFLLKVLSVHKPLSIQAHPDKSLAERLHEQFPELYKDDNHKPEMAIALGDFEALCQFRSAEEIRANVAGVPELAGLVADAVVPSAAGDDGSWLRAHYGALMRQSDATVRAAVETLVARVEGKPEAERSETERVALHLNRFFPGDVGVMSAFFLNYVKLTDGQALFLAANEPHAYVSGNCVECMATSDNVVRGGCTPKHKDVDTLLNMLTYQMGAPKVLTGQAVDDVAHVYAAPVPEFKVIRLQPGGKETYTLAKQPGPSVLLTLGGTATVQAGDAAVKLAKGVIVFAETASASVTLTNCSSDLVVFQATVADLA